MGGGDGSMQAGREWMRGLCSGDEIGTMSRCDFSSCWQDHRRRGSWKRGCRYPVRLLCQLTRWRNSLGLRTEFRMSLHKPKL